MNLPLNLPHHPQHYPDLLLPTRLEEYVVDGYPPSKDRRWAKTVSGREVLDAALAHKPDIDPRYFVATCFHEAGCTNEVDTEIATLSSPNGFQSFGAYQIGEYEAHAYGFTPIDMLNLNSATSCMVSMAEDHRKNLRLWAGITGPDPDYTDIRGKVWPGGNMRAYLAMAHNHGIGFCHLTIRRYGLDWAKYKARNPNDPLVMHSYGEDCITGGPYWPAGAV